MKINFKRVGKFFKRHSHQIAAVVAGVGVVVTAVEAGKAGARIQSKITAIEASRGEALTKKEIVELAADDAVRPVIAGTVTLAAIATGTIASEKMIVGISATCAGLVKKHAEYEENVRAIDPKVDIQAKSRSAKDRVQKYIRDYNVSGAPEDVLYYDTHTMQTFHGRINLPLLAEQRLRDILRRKGRITENEYRIVMGELTDPIGGDYYGWDQFSFYDSTPIDDDVSLQIYEELSHTDDGIEYHVLYLSAEADADFFGNDAAYVSSPFDVR